MTVKINYKNKALNNTLRNLILFTDEKFNINGLKKHILNSEYSYISDLINKKKN